MSLATAGKRRLFTAHPQGCHGASRQVLGRRDESYGAPSRAARLANLGMDKRRVGGASLPPALTVAARRDRWARIPRRAGAKHHVPHHSP